MWQELHNIPRSRFISNIAILDNHLCAASTGMGWDQAYLWCYLVDYKKWLELGNFPTISPYELSIIGLPDHSIMTLEIKMPYRPQLSKSYKLKPGEP